MEIPDGDDSVRPADAVQQMRLLDPAPFVAPIVEDDPELEMAIALSIASYEENLHLLGQMAEIESNEEKAKRLLEEREREEEERKQTEREKRRLYKESIRPHFQSIQPILISWHRLPEMRFKAMYVEAVIERYYQESGVYLYIRETEYHKFYDILNEMKDGKKIRNPLKDEDFQAIEHHIRLLEDF